MNCNFFKDSRIWAIALIGVLLLSSCNTLIATEEQFNPNRGIAVISREAGSGTRGAFVEILGIDRAGVDNTFIEADVQNGTNGVLTAVIGNTHAIGYISLGSLNNSVTALDVDGISAIPENILNGSYPLFRTFYFAAGELNELARDFLDFVLSAEGQEIVTGRYYVSVDANAPAFGGSTASGTLVITGSTSVFSLVEALGEAFEAINPNASVEVHSTGSSAGIIAVIDGTAHLGMSSRNLHPAELEVVNAIEIAFDGLAVIVNNNNPVHNMTVEDIRQVFEGEIFNWNALY